jgi:oligopeptide/dipeptide ABC transporter ATP-binding protein
MSDLLLRVEDLASYFFLDEGVLKAVDGVSFDIGTNETVALVGESGCGKTIVALSLINLIPAPGRIVQGKVVLGGEDIVTASRERLRAIRGKEFGFVFQEPGAALNPVYTVGDQICEVLQLHRGLGRREAEREGVRLLGATGIPDPEARARCYPFQLSGGMRQRAAIAMAVSTRPKLLIADEPTTALDVSVQAEILDLLRSLQERYQMSVLIITHDLGVVAEIAQRVLVMYAGRLVESAPVDALFAAPRHPYTQGLLDSVRCRADLSVPLRGIPGAVPDLFRLPEGCSFHPRCLAGDDECTSAFPPTIATAEGRSCACYKADSAR